MRQRLAALHWFIRHRVHRLGVVELLLAVLIGTSCALWFWVTTPLTVLRDDAAAEVAYVEARHKTTGEQVGNAARQTHGALGNLLAILPPQAAREQQLKKLGTVATQAGVAWVGSEYQTQILTGLPVTRTTLQLSVRGRYPALRIFLRDLLVLHPNLAVTQLGIEGGAGDNDLPTLSLQSQLYFRADTERISTERISP